MGRGITAFLILLLLFAGCIRGSVATEKNESARDVLENETAEPARVNETRGPVVENETASTEESRLFLPWETGFRDLKSFYISYYYIKAGHIDLIRGASGALPQTYSNASPEYGVLRIWFSNNKLRIDRYDEGYVGKGLCEGSPTEHIEVSGIRYGLVAREVYAGNSIKEWRHTVVNKAIIAGTTEKWKCEMRFASRVLQRAANSPTKAMEMAYNLYSNAYGKPSYYAADNDYDAEVERTKKAYDEYYARDGTRYVRETEALRQSMQLIGRHVRKFYIMKEWGGYGYELRDAELGLGLAFYIEKITSTSGAEIVLEQPLLVYKALEFNENVDVRMFELD